MHHQHNHQQEMTESACMQCVIERDQRTTKQRIRDDRIAWLYGGMEPVINAYNQPSTYPAAASTPNDKSNCDTCDKLRDYTPATNRCRQFKLFSYFSQRAYLTLVVCVFLCIASRHTSMSAAIPQDEPIWMHPCGAEPINGQKDAINSMILDQLLNSIISLTDNAAVDADNATKAYVRTIWDTSVERHHKTWRAHHENWLYPNQKKLPKMFNEKLSDDMVTKLQTSNSAVQNISEILMDSFERFQRIAVGIEQMIGDIRSKHADNLNVLSSLMDKLTNIQNNIRLVLCEIELSLMEHNMKISRQPVYVGRDIMPEAARTGSSPLRDWVILREYVNLLEYNNESIKILKNRIADETKGESIDLPIK